MSDIIKKQGTKSWRHYPSTMIRALAAVWIFSGLRRDEIMRLRLGCIRWQASESIDNKSGKTKSKLCLLDIPVNKTNTAFTKPVDSLLGELILAWEHVRPPQPSWLDLKTAENVQLLFSHRGKPIGKTYLNKTLIPLLCHKAGVPLSDARGKITSHRVRATIATQLYNAKEPLTLFELQEWLGHRSPESTRHYTKINPTILAKAYDDAGYFARNVRTIEVLIDQDAIKQGKPWKYYDLGHGYCTYVFFEKCQHRMACARCDFYKPKQSAQGQLLEGKNNLLKLKQDIPLTEEEVSAINDGVSAYDHLLDKLKNKPTQDGTSPCQINVPFHSHKK